MTKQNQNPRNLESKIGLILTREKDEKIYLLCKGYEPIIVTLVEIKGNRARLGINASQDYIIIREEIIKKIYPSTFEHLQQGGIVTENLLSSFPDTK